MITSTFHFLHFPGNPKECERILIGVCKVYLRKVFAAAIMKREAFL